MEVLIGDKVFRSFGRQTAQMQALGVDTTQTVEWQGLLKKDGLVGKTEVEVG